MSRFHMHIAVAELDPSIAYYTAVFAAEPTVVRDDYAKWQLDDPRIHFAISTRGRQPGLDHVGIQADTAEELEAIEQRLSQAGIAATAQKGATCCYARSDKYWSVDPQGIAWEAFHTLASAPVFGETPDAAESAACCTPQTTGCC